ncbi:MAG: alpha/beta hydrolase [Pseudomonadota bacterium]
MSPTHSPPPTVALVHSSASSPAQWAALEHDLGADFAPLNAALTGHGGQAPWAGHGPLSLAQEASALAAAIGPDQEVHLVGHSYGGAVALRFALERPGRVRSLTLFEPTLFTLLRFAPEEADALQEILDLAQFVGARVLQGDHRGAMAAFVDYWNGDGAWAATPERRRAALAEKALLVANHFAGLEAQGPSPEAFAALQAPVLVMCGTRSPKPARAVSRVLVGAIPHARHRTIAGAGHMAPLTQPQRVNPLILDALRSAEDAAAAAPAARAG